MFDHFLGPVESQHALRLFRHANTRFDVAKSVGSLLLSNTIVGTMPEDQIFVILAKAPFEADEEECTFVASAFFHLLQANDVLPMMTQHSGLELGKRCLVSLSLFHKALEHRCQRHGSPRPDFYRQAGKRVFLSEGLTGVSSHFEQWEAYVSEVFV